MYSIAYIKLCINLDYNHLLNTLNIISREENVSYFPESTVSQNQLFQDHDHFKCV